DIDTVSSDLRGGGTMAERADVAEHVACGADFGAIAAAIVRTVRIGVNAETLVVVLLENTAHQMCGGMIMDIARQIPDRDPPSRHRRLPLCGKLGTIPGCDPLC